MEQRALELRDMGVDGSLRELRVLAFMDLLQERDGTDRLTGQVPDAQDSTAQDSEPDDRDNTGLADDDADGNGGGTGPRGPGKPSGPSGAGGTRLAAQVIITVPFEAWSGQASGPGEAGGFGLVDPEQIQDLLAAAARDRDSRGCVTLLGPDGTAVAHGCGRGRFTMPSGNADQDNPDRPDPPATPGQRRPAGPATWSRQAEDMLGRLRVSVAPIARDHCDHRNAESARLPSRRLRHLIQARNPRCTAPGCGRPAAKCEADHTLAWEDGGITCECNLEPLCKHHHIVKHLNGWRLVQAKPGVLTWRTPAGRTYTTTPSP